MQLTIDPGRMCEDMRSLAQFGRYEGGVERRALGGPDMEARRWLLARMQQAGLDAEIDAIGNVIGRTRHQRRIIIGSHTDSVPKGGWLDGALGVIYGLEIARAATDHAGQIGVEVISFSDEEGHYSALLGSRTFCGIIDPSSYSEISNNSGECLTAALERSGLANRALARLNPKIHAAYLEAHIEQGPVLENEGVEIGVVTDIVGLREYAVSFKGEANHAGTTPMNLRRNAGAALARFACKFDEACRQAGHPQTVWNIGKLCSDPPAANVVPALASCSVQFRSTQDSILDNLSELIATGAAAAAEVHNAEAIFSRSLNVPATPMDAELSKEIELAARDVGASSNRMPSGAGHDAMVFAAHIPTAMLFIPSEGGISHSTAENSSEASLRCGLSVFARAVERIASRLEN